MSLNNFGNKRDIDYESRKLFPLNVILYIVDIVPSLFFTFSVITAAIAYIFSNKMDRFLYCMNIIMYKNGYSVAISLAMALSLCIVVGTYPNFRRRGGRYGRLRVAKVWRRFLPWLPYQLPRLIHDFEHEMFLFKGAMAAIAKSRTQKSEKYIQTKSLTESACIKMLPIIQKSVQVVVGEQVSVHIKVFVTEENRTGSAQSVRLSEAKLGTLVRCPSEKETKEAKRVRKDTELFRIIPLEGNETIKEHVERVTVLLKGRSSQSSDLVNTSYNQVLGPNDHYVIYNDLKSSVGTGQFLSQSFEFEEYYCSVCVFLICPPLHQGKRPAVLPKGLLIVDCKKNNVFEVDRMKDLVGYFAHRLTGIFPACLPLEEENE